MALKSDRPLYAGIFLVVSILFLCATFLPFLYSILFPNEDIRRVVSALEGRGSPPLDADTVVQEAAQAAGTLTRAIPIGYYMGGSTRMSLAGPQKPEHIRASQITYVAWFAKRPKAMLIAITVYENDAGQKAFGISDSDAAAIVRAYLLPIVLFASALLVFRRSLSRRNALRRATLSAPVS
jgi:hypothetical protein